MFVVTALAVLGVRKRLKPLLRTWRSRLTFVVTASAVLGVRKRLKSLLRTWFVVTALAVLCACRAAESPSLGRVGVCAEWTPDLQAQLDNLGDIWYYDYRYETPTVAGHLRLYMVKYVLFDAELAAAIRSHPGSWWAVGNEPNDPHQDYRTPAEYARFFYSFTQFAKKSDAKCKIIPGGVANADWRWANAFREEYRRLYNRYPAVDGWNIHNYLLDTTLDPYDVSEFKRRILAFRHWMMEIGEANKPLFLTEFGVLYGVGCCERPLDPPEKTIRFMRETVSWLAETDYVQHWAWFIVNNAREFNGGLYDAAGELSSYGETYRELQVSLDRSP